MEDIVRNDEEIGEHLLQALILGDCSSRMEQTDRDDDLVIFKCRGTRKIAHRIILATHSSYFCDLFKEQEKCRSSSLPIALSISADIFDLVREYLYTTNMIALRMDQCLQLLAAAKTFKLYDLVEQVKFAMKMNAEGFISNVKRMELTWDEDMDHLEDVLPELCLTKQMQLDLVSNIQSLAKTRPKKYCLSLDLIGRICAQCNNCLRIIYRNNGAFRLGEIKGSSLVTVPSKIKFLNSLPGKCVMKGRDLFICKQDSIVVYDVMAGTMREVTLEQLQGISLFKDDVYAWNSHNLYTVQNDMLTLVVTHRKDKLVNVFVTQNEAAECLKFVAQTSKDYVMYISHGNKKSDLTTKKILAKSAKLIGVHNGVVYALVGKHSKHTELVSFRNNNEPTRHSVKISTLEFNWCMFMDNFYHVCPAKIKNESWELEMFDAVAQRNVSIPLKNRHLTFVPSIK